MNVIPWSCGQTGPFELVAPNRDVSGGTHWENTGMVEVGRLNLEEHPFEVPENSDVLKICQIFHLLYKA